jgi:hypothetical protein
MVDLIQQLKNWMRNAATSFLPQENKKLLQITKRSVLPIEKITSIG